MSLTNELIKGLLSEEENKQITAVYAGGFKPPTGGHFEVVQQALKQNPEIDEFIIFIGNKERNGISQEESLLIWEIYNNYLPFKVKIEPTSKPPIKAVYNFASDHPTREVLWVIGAREGNEDDFKDITSRTKSITKYPNLELRTIITSGGVSGTAARNASKISLDKFKKFVPDVLSDKETEEVYNIVADKILENKPQDGKASPYGSGYNKVDEVLDPKTFNYKPLLKSLTKSMEGDGLKLQPYPKVTFIHDEEANANDFFGKTAYYDPNNNEVVLYTLGRHPKDIMRSYAHELIHVHQNHEDRLKGISTDNVNEDDYLEKIEREAYEKGNISFRSWTNKTLNEAVVGDKIECDNCDWSWDIVSGGDDLFVCHKCGHDNEPISENTGNSNSLNENQDLSPFDYDQDGNESRIKRDINNKKGWRRLGSKSSQNSAIKKYLDKYTSGYKWSNPPKSEKFSKENDKMYKTPYIMYVHLLQTSEGKNNIIDALKGVTANEPDNTLKQVLQALTLVFMDKEDQFKKVYLQYKDMIENNAKDDDGANPFSALKYADENFTDKEGIFTKFVRNGWSAGKFNLNEDEDPFGLNAYARELALLREEEGNYKIYLDMDGVIADFNTRFKDLSGIEPREFESKYGRKAFWDFIDEENKIKFWVGIPPMPGASELVSYVSKHNYEILTAPSIKKQSRLGKNLWVRNHVGDIFPSKPKVTFKFSKEKHKVKQNLSQFDILIDDRQSIINNWNNAGGFGILYQSTPQAIADLKKLGL